MKTVAILIGGITDKMYVANDIQSNPSIKGYFEEHFNEVVELNVNAILDWGVVPFKPLLKYGDVVRFYVNPVRRRACTDLVERTIKKYQDLGYKVTIVAHSLGTVVAMDSEITVDSVMLCGCPIEFKTMFSRMGARFFLTPPWANPKLRCHKLTYLWSPADIVSAHEPKHLERFVIADTKTVLKVPGPHDFSNYLNQLSELISGYGLSI